MRCELRMPFDLRHGPWAPALVGDGEFVTATDGEGWDDFQREGRGMVVIDNDANIGLRTRDPFLGTFEAFEHRLPIGLGHLLVVPRRTDCGDVRSSYARDDL